MKWNCKGGWAEQVKGRRREIGMQRYLAGLLNRIRDWSEEDKAAARPSPARWLSNEDEDEDEELPNFGGSFETLPINFCKPSITQCFQRQRREPQNSEHLILFTIQKPLSLCIPFLKIWVLRGLGFITDFDSPGSTLEHCLHHARFRFRALHWARFLFTWRCQICETPLQIFGGGSRPKTKLAWAQPLGLGPVK